MKLNQHEVVEIKGVEVIWTCRRNGRM